MTSNYFKGNYLNFFNRIYYLEYTDKVREMLLHSINWKNVNMKINK